MSGSLQVLTGGEFTASGRPIGYDPVVDEFRVDGAGSNASPPLTHCPWCDIELTLSRREAWFERLDQLGLTPDDELPVELTSDQWWASDPSMTSPVENVTSPRPESHIEASGIAGSGIRAGDARHGRRRLGIVSAVLAPFTTTAVVGSSWSSAEAADGSISGTVTSESGATLTGTTVVLTSEM